MSSTGKPETDWKYTWYVRDAAGTLLATCARTQEPQGEPVPINCPPDEDPRFTAQAETRRYGLAVRRKAVGNAGGGR